MSTPQHDCGQPGCHDYSAHDHRVTQELLPELRKAQKRCQETEHFQREVGSHRLNALIDEIELELRFCSPPINTMVTATTGLVATIPSDIQEITA